MSLVSQKYKLSITFTGPILGSQPGKDTPASDFIRDKVRKENPDADIADEVPTLPEELEKGTTGFHRDAKGKPILFNYQIKGVIKAAGDVLNGLDNFRALKSKITNTVFVSPRQIPIKGKLRKQPLERPLLGQTMKGPRTSLARSEVIEEGAKIVCELEVMLTPKVKLPEETLRDILDYAAKLGVGQWRNSGIYGQFEYKLEAL
jgi:hypothetical protein